MNRFEKIRSEIAAIEQEIYLLKRDTSLNSKQESIQELSKKNDRIRKAFQSIAQSV